MYDYQEDYDVDEHEQSEFIAHWLAEHGAPEEYSE